MYRLISNPVGQNADNLIKLYESTKGCCGGDANPACQYDVTIPTANPVNNIIYKDLAGVDKTVTFSPAVTGAVAVKAAIRAAITAGNLFEDDDDAVGAVSSRVSAGNTIYSITGEVIVVSMLHNGATTVNAVAKCDRINVCSFALDYAGAAATAFTVNGVVAALGSLTLVGSTAANVVTAITAAANWPTTAQVAVVETATAFEIRITDVGSNTYNINGADFARTNCAAGYVA